MLKIEVPFTIITKCDYSDELAEFLNSCYIKDIKISREPRVDDGKIIIDIVVKGYAICGALDRLENKLIESENMYTIRY